MPRGFAIAVLVLLLAVLTTDRVDAQVRVGAHASVGTESGLGLGGRLIFPLVVSPLGLDGSLDGNYFFGGGAGVSDWIETNANIRLPIPLARDFDTRIGGGLNATFITVDVGDGTETNAEIGFNLVGVLALPDRALAPYAELRAVFGGADQIVLTGGFSVGGRRSPDRR